MGHRSVGAARIGVGVGVLGALLAAMTVAAGAGADASTATASLSIAPPSQTVDAGDTVTVEVSINNVSNMAQWDFTLSYDPAVLDYTGAVADKTMLQVVGPVLCPGVIADETAGKVTVGCNTTVPIGTAGVGGSGKLATVTFTAKAAGKSPLVFTRIEFGTAGDAQGRNYDIAVTGSTGMVCVDACSGVEPTPTYNPSLLTPTAVSGGSQYDPPDEADPNAPAGGYPTPTPRAGTGRPVAGGTTGGGTTGGTTSGTLAGSTVRSGSGSAAGVSGATDGNGFPVAGTGAGSGEGALAWPAWIIIISGSAGLALLSAGALASRRGSA